MTTTPFRGATSVTSEDVRIIPSTGSRTTHGCADDLSSTSNQQFSGEIGTYVDHSVIPGNQHYLFVLVPLAGKLDQGVLYVSEDALLPARPEQISAHQLAATPAWPAVSA